MDYPQFIEPRLLGGARQDTVLLRWTLEDPGEDGVVASTGAGVVCLAVIQRVIIVL